MTSAPWADSFMKAQNVKVAVELQGKPAKVVLPEDVVSPRTARPARFYVKDLTCEGGDLDLIY
jgi:hypothetical protein